MKILLVSSKYMPEYSGSGFRAHNLYKRLHAKHDDLMVDVLSGSVTENDSLKYEYDGFDVNRVACKRFPALSSFPIIRRLQNALNFHSEFKVAINTIKGLAKEAPPDLIHIFGKNNVTAAAIHYANAENIPLLIELCNEMPSPLQHIPFPYKTWISGEANTKHVYVCISERLKRMCISSKVPETNIWCRPNPIDEGIFRPVSSEAKRALRKKLAEFALNDKLLVYIAKYKHIKNHRFLLEVLARLPKTFKLIIGGPLAEKGPFKKESDAIVSAIKNDIERLNLKPRVKMISGFQNNVHEYYQMADAYLFPTKEEGLGTPMLESIASGIPVVVNKIEGITDVWVENGENGFILSLEPRIFAKAIIEVLEDF